MVFYAVCMKVQYTGTFAAWKTCQTEIATLEEAVAVAGGPQFKGSERHVVRMTETPDKWEREIVAEWKTVKKDGRYSIKRVK